MQFHKNQTIMTSEVSAKIRTWLAIIASGLVILAILATFLFKWWSAQEKIKQVEFHRQEELAWRSEYVEAQELCLDEIEADVDTLSTTMRKLEIEQRAQGEKINGLDGKLDLVIAKLD